MQAEYAVGLAEPEPLDEPEPLVPLVVSACAPEPFALLFVSTCATLAPEEWPPQAEARRESPTTPASASARSGARLRCELSPFLVRALDATVTISSPSQAR
jgi:hypothetical protein